MVEGPKSRNDFSVIFFLKKTVVGSLLIQNDDFFLNVSVFRIKS